MNKQAVFHLAGTDFLVDIDKMALVQVGNAENEISFINNMKDLGTHYELIYHPDEVSAVEAIFDAQQLLTIKVPKLTELDPEGMAEKYKVSLADLKGKTDFEVIVDQELLQKRLAGELPGIEICGEPYFVDLRLNELRHQALGQEIHLKRLDLAPDGTTYQAFYDPQHKIVVVPNYNLTAIPEGLVMIEIPNELKLDPIGAARKYGLEEKDVLRLFPIQKELKARVVPVAETGLPALVLRNQQNIAQEKREQQRRRLKPKF